MPILDVDAVRRELAALPVEQFEAGQTMLAAGRAAGKLYFLDHGAIEVVRDGVRLGTESEAGAVFGEIAALLDRPHGAEVRAAERTTLHVAPPDLMTREPAVALYVATILAQRIDAANRSLVEARRQLEADHRDSGILERIAAHLRDDGTEGTSLGYSVTPGPLLAAVSRLPLSTYPAGAQVITRGTRTDKLYILEDGSVEVLNESVRIGEVTTRGAILGELAVLLDRPHGADVRALETSTLRIAEAETFLGDSPAAALHIAVITARRISAANRAVIEARHKLDPEPAGPLTRMLDRIGSTLRIGAS
jgi:CRP/FNR family cyclic AMP-dependent transcriptional regulator